MTAKGQSQKSSAASANAEKQLWASVINQALEDAVTYRSERTNTDIDTARRWLTAPSQDFDFVCGLAGLEPWQVRAHALSEINKSNANPRKIGKARGGQRAADRGVVRDFDQTAGDQFPRAAREIAKIDFSRNRKLTPCP
jgi:hypothetical protein